MVGLLGGGVGAVAGDGLVVEIRRVPAQLCGQLSTQTLVVVATRHYALYSSVRCARCRPFAGNPQRPTSLLPQYPQPYFATFWLNPWGLMLEAVCHHDRELARATESVVAIQCGR